MVASRRHRRRQAAEAKLVEAGEELLLVLAAEDAKGPIAGHGGAGAAGKHQNEAGEVGVMEDGDGPPSGFLGICRRRRQGLGEWIGAHVSAPCFRSR